MKPNFALSLSFDGIKLLHRAAGGWREVGDVAVTAEDLAAELAMLRKTAASLAPGGVRSKLLIPASQIKYLTIETQGLSDAARRKAAEAALHDATPYEVSELAYDISVDGPRTHIAAVARETLAEAEAFATEHRFHPVSFVAVPGDADYLGEPFFGQTEAAADFLEPGEVVEPDGIAVVVVGAMAPEPATAPVALQKDAQGEAPAEPKPTEAAAPAISDRAEAEKTNLPEATPAPEPAMPAAKPEALTPVADAPAVKATPPAAKITPTEPAPKPTPAAAPSPSPAPKTEQAAPLSGGTPKVPDVTPPPASTPAPDIVQTPVGDAPVVKVPAPEAPAPATDTPLVVTGFASRRNGTTGAPKPLGGAQRIAVKTPVPDSSSLTQPPLAADTSEPAPARTGFLSRRKPRTGKAAPVPAPNSTVLATGTEAERMTVFGARSEQVGGKPRFLGLILTVILLVFLAGVAAWAAVFLDDGIAGLIKKDETRATASAPENQIDPEIIRTPADIPTPNDEAPGGVQLAALDPVLSAEEAVDAVQNPRAEPQIPVITEQQAAARYAVTGIWPLAPDTPLALPAPLPQPVYHNTLDATGKVFDAIALPAPQSFETDVALAALASPPPFGQTIARDALGLVVPTPEGVVTPEGYTLVAASPPLKPPQTITRFETAPEVVAVPEVVSVLAAFRPQNRPAGLAENVERSQLGGVSRGELAVFRPSVRPSSVQERAQRAQEAEDAEEAAAAQADEARAAAAAQAATAAAAAALATPQPPAASAAIQDATRLATVQSRRPDTRPRNFARIVRRAEREAPEETRVAATASVAPRSVAPALPSSASVTRSATVKNAINLRRVNLIGVYGKPSSRRALVRLANGRYEKVSVGDRLDGGRVNAISNTELSYQKGGRNVVLQMP